MIDDLSTTLELTREGDLSAFLGIQIDKIENGSLRLTQEGLIKRVLEATKMQECRPTITPACLSRDMVMANEKSGETVCLLDQA
jgi:hypothetical protein